MKESQVFLRAKNDLEFPLLAEGLRKFGLLWLLVRNGVMLGGWSIIKTIGRGIYTIAPIHSTNSQLASLGSVLIATIIGAPVSTTHVVVGSVIGVGAADEYKMVHWGIAKEIIMAWFITIPLTAIVSAVVYRY